MNNFNRDDRSNRGRNFGRGNFGGRDSGRPEMHHAVCSECGKDCEVPFRPTGDKPVYCSACFDNKGGGRSERFNNRDFGRRDRDNDRHEMHHAVCDECGNDCEVPFRPSGDKPIYCSNCFSSKGGRNKFSRGQGGDNNNEQLLKQISLLNTKIDKILKVLIPEEKNVVFQSNTSEKVLDIKPEKFEKKITIKKTKPKKKPEVVPVEIVS